jgi:hypothetical protein
MEVNMKKVISTVLCFILTLCLLAACGSNGGSGSGSDTVSTSAPGDSAPTDNSDNSGSASTDSSDNNDIAADSVGTDEIAAADDDASGNATAEVDYSEHETFTYWLYATPNDYYSSYSDNPVVQYLNKKFNVTLEYEQPATGTESDSMSLMFGTGQYTDAIDMSYYTGSISELYDDGVIINIADYLKYMPNFKALMDSNENFRRACYNDDGQILLLKIIHSENELVWGGLVYRRDILETMTGGNIAFPSGNNQPTTIEDWDYMLPLMKAYFEAAGMQEYAPLIIPYNGYFVMGELANGFGVNTSYYIENDVVKYGPIEEGFYNYLKKMNEWYTNGYIYQDFASRTNDLFYLPNTSLTYGGAAGAWYGLSGQIGDVMSMPEYGLFYDVQPVPSPIDKASGQSIAFPFSVSARTDNIPGTAITSSCKNIPKLLSILDYMYSEHGGMLRCIGLTVEDGAAEDPIYQSMGLQDGTYWFEGDTFVRNPVLTDGSLESGEAAFGTRFNSMNNNTYVNQIANENEINANVSWRSYGDNTNIAKMPNALYRPTAEDKTFADNNVQITDYLNTSIPKFIMGTEDLTEESWATFVEQLKTYGIEENIRIQQAAYDRYLQR